MQFLLQRVFPGKRHVPLPEKDVPPPEKFEPNAARDIFLTTYPRSGTNWLSCIAAVNSWLGRRHKPTSFELTSFRYEDLISDPISHTESLAKILGADVSRARIEELSRIRLPAPCAPGKRKGKMASAQS